MKEWSIHYVSLTIIHINLADFYIQEALGNDIVE